MITIEIKNINTGEVFEKKFETVKEARKFLVRRRHSLVIRTMSVSSESKQAVEELNNYFKETI